MRLGGGAQNRKQITMEKGGLYGGPSYNYTYGKLEEGLDPTEQQYFEEQALQQSLQQHQYQYLGQSNYQAEQSYSQSYFKTNTPWTRGMPPIQQHFIVMSKYENLITYILKNQKTTTTKKKQQTKRNNEPLDTDTSIVACLCRLSRDSKNGEG